MTADDKGVVTLTSARKLTHNTVECSTALELELHTPLEDSRERPKQKEAVVSVNNYWSLETAV